MSKLFLNAQKRDATGSNKSTHLRKSGFIPGILYGGHMEAQPVMIEKNEFEKFIAVNYVGSKVYVKIEGKEVMALLKEVQKDVFGNSVLHVDLQALTKGDKVKLHVKLHYVGKDKLPLDLVTQELVNELEIEALPEHLIDSIPVDVSGMILGDMIKVSDLPITKNEHIRVISDSNLNLFTLMSRPQIKEEVVEEAVENPSTEVVN